MEAPTSAITETQATSGAWLFLVQNSTVVPPADFEVSNVHSGNFL